jgi:hypothetical protein
MASMQLDLREVPSVSNLRVANLTTDDGVNLLASAVGTDSVHIVSADGSLEGFGGLTIIGPGVTTIGRDVGDWVRLALTLYHGLKGDGGGGGGGGGGNFKCTSTTTTTVSSDGKSTSTTVTACGPA